MDNMKISEILTNPNPEINRTTQSSNDTFKFMLVSNIAEQELQQKIGGLMSQIDEQGKKISKKKSKKLLTKRKRCDKILNVAAENSNNMNLENERLNSV